MEIKYDLTSQIYLKRLKGRALSDCIAYGILHWPLSGILRWEDRHGYLLV